MEKMVKIVFGVLFLVLISGLVMAEEVSVDGLLDEMNNYSAEMEGQELPGFLKSYLGDVKINGYISLEGGETLVVGVVTEEGKVKEFKKEGLEEVDLEIHASEEVIKEAMSGGDPVNDLKKAWEEGKVSYTAVGFWNKIKFGVAGLFLKMISWFDSGETEVEDEEVVVGEEDVGEEVSGEGAPASGDEEEEDFSLNEEEVAELENTMESTVVELVDGGFGESEVIISVGEKVVWQNVREKGMNKAIIIGGTGCPYGIKSGVFYPGEYYSWVFEEVGTCKVVDGIFTTQIMRVVVE